MNQSFHTVVFVCEQNIYRSIAAEAVFKYLCAATQLPLRITSAGIHAGDGAPPHDYLAEVAKRRGYNLDGLRSRRLTEDDLRAGTLLVASDLHVATVVRSLLGRARGADAETMGGAASVADAASAANATNDAGAGNVPSATGAADTANVANAAGAVEEQDLAGSSGVAQSAPPRVELLSRFAQTFAAEFADNGDLVAGESLREARDLLDRVEDACLGLLNTLKPK